MFFRGGHFTATDEIRKVILRRPADQLRSLAQNSSSLGMFGSDVFVELDDRVQEEMTFEPFEQIDGTFYVGSTAQVIEQTIAKIESGDELVFATSYPKRLTVIAEELGFALGQIVDMSGGVEAAQMDRDDIDAIFELKETGRSITDNGIVVIEDFIGSIDLGAIWRNER